MRRTSPFRAGAALVLTLSLAATACGGGNAPEPADLVLTNGRVVTVDENVPDGEAVAIVGSTIRAVGSSADMQRFVGPATEVIDLEGRLVIPGFIEGHGHFMGLGQARMILDLTTAERWEDIVAMVEEAAGTARPGEWIRGHGWHQEKWSLPPSPLVEGNPVHASLSAVSLNNPVNLTHASGHAAFANARAMELAGIGRGTADPPGGTIVRDARGNATGLLRETAQRLVGAKIAEFEAGRSEEDRAQDRLTMVRLAGEEALSKGITSFHDAGADFATIDFFRELDDAGELPVRIYAMVRRASNEEMEQKLAGARRIAEGNGHLTVRGIKRQIDGALGSHGAWLLEPYEDLPGSSGLNLEEIPDIRRTAELAVENGYQLNTHAIGDRANREVLDIYQQVFSDMGVEEPGQLRWRIEHAQHLDPSDIPRFAEMGIIASVQGVHATSDGPWIPLRIGEERARTGAYRWRDLIDAGVVVTNGTDTPVEDVSPIASFYSAVSRMTSTGERFYPDQAMTRMEALRSYTINNAFAEFDESRKGSITPGKLADLVVLSQDILTIAEDQIPSTQADLTIVGGEIRFRR